MPVEKPGPALSETLLNNSGFWKYFEPANETTDPVANRFSESTQTK